MSWALEGWTVDRVADRDEVKNLEARRLKAVSRFSSPAFLVYDGQCQLCWNAKEVIVGLSRSGALTPVPFGDPRVSTLLPGFEASRAEGNFHLVWEDGRVKSGSEAIPDVLRLLPGGAGPAWLVEHVPGFGWVNGWLYRIISKYRPRPQ